MFLFCSNPIIAGERSQSGRFVFIGGLVTALVAAKALKQNRS
jgi:hypothetical protein